MAEPDPAPSPVRARPSRVGALRLSCRIADGAWVHRRPFLLYYKPTARCDCRCSICDRWRRQARQEEELPLETVRGVLARFRRAGATVLTLWGGEPLLRKDLPQILAAAKELGFRTSLCTNCNQLAKRVDDIAPLLDVMLCSLDGRRELHDELRGMPGLFDRAVDGIRAAARHEGCDVKIWAVLHRRNVGDVEPLARLAAELGVGIEFFPLSPIAGYNDDLVLGSAELDRAFGQVEELQRHGLPIRNPARALRIMRTGRAFRCNFPRIAIHLDHQGNVSSCEDPQGHPLHAWGGHAEFEPRTRYGTREYREVTRDLMSCNRCRLPCVLELADSLPRALAGMFLSRTGRRRGWRT
jgi:MoaA/NifB/PqqE/SkfB family radical SAM enzyme